MVTVATALALATASSLAAPPAAALRDTQSVSPHLQTVSPAALRARTFIVGGSQVRISGEQLAALDKIPASVRAKMGPPVGGKILSVAELNRLASGEGESTVMCPSWSMPGSKASNAATNP